MSKKHQACPCLHTTPCHPRCACVMPLSSSGCRRCCSHGSLEQQRLRAEHLARIIDAEYAKFVTTLTEGA